MYSISKMKKKTWKEVKEFRKSKLIKSYSKILIPLNESKILIRDDII